MGQREEDYMYRKWKKSVEENGQLKNDVHDLKIVNSELINRLEQACYERGRECFCGKHGRRK